MLNSEIGTYQIVQALDIDPIASVKVEGRAIFMTINDKVFQGNYAIVKKLCDTTKLNFTFENNERVRLLNPIQVLSEVFGVDSDADWENVYDKNGTWVKANQMATKISEAVVDSSFTLESDLEL